MACVEFVHTFVLLCTKHTAHRLQNAYSSDPTYKREKRQGRLCNDMWFGCSHEFHSNSTPHLSLFQYPGKRNPLIWCIRKSFRKKRHDNCVDYWFISNIFHGEASGDHKTSLSSKQQSIQLYENVKENIKIVPFLMKDFYKFIRAFCLCLKMSKVRSIISFIYGRSNPAIYWNIYSFSVPVHR